MPVSEITSLIDAAEIIVEVFTIILVAGAVGEDDLRILRSELLHCIHIAVACAKDDIAALFYTFPNGSFNRFFILVVNVILANNLVVLQAERFLHVHNSLVMRVGVAGGVLRISNVDNADFDLPFCNRSERAFWSLRCIVVG